MPDDSVDSYLADVENSYGSDSGGSSNGSGSNGASLDSILSGVSRLAGTAGTLYGQVAGRPAAPKPAAAASSGLSKYLPWAIGGAVLLFVLVLVTGRR